MHNNTSLALVNNECQFSMTLASVIFYVKGLR